MMKTADKITIRSRLSGVLIGFGFLAVAAAARGAPVFMSAQWAEGACAAWNADPVLTGELLEPNSKWLSNDKNRGYKLMQIYRTDCQDSPRIEMKISEQNGKAWCVYGGAVQSEIDTDADYVMHATTERWQQMGNGEYGPMKAMMFGRLKFDGPMWEAMKNMGPFENFLLLAGKVPADTGSCPQ